ncbi:MAG: hypothetical protein EBZ48_04595 [Proteobacteria bacterium]|nr:hypothetical protein [Pseudomonadota bacterium]
MESRVLFVAFLFGILTLSAVPASAQEKSGGQCVGDIAAPYGAVDVQDLMRVLSNFGATGKTYARNAPADINLDRVINGADASFVLSALGPCPQPCQYDLNGDKQVNAVDLAIQLSMNPTGPALSGLLNQWGDCSKQYSAATKRTPNAGKPYLLRK